jgi:hypothetical protein
MLSLMHATQVPASRDLPHDAVFTCLPHWLSGNVCVRAGKTAVLAEVDCDLDGTLADTASTSTSTSTRTATYLFNF